MIVVCLHLHHDVAVLIRRRRRGAAARQPAAAGRGRRGRRVRQLDRRTLGRRLGTRRQRRRRYGLHPPADDLRTLLLSSLTSPLAGVRYPAPEQLTI